MKQGKAWLLKVAGAIAGELKTRSVGTRLHIRMPSRAVASNSEGWYAIIGNFGKGSPRLEIWFDRFTRRKDRKFWFGLHTNRRADLLKIAHLAKRKLTPVRHITMSDIADIDHFVLRRKLPNEQFHRPLLEKYRNGQTFLGVYDPTLGPETSFLSRFTERVAAFFDTAARTLPGARPQDESYDVFPRWENRKQVVSHLRRERSPYLAAQRKAKDNYACQVCDASFARTYGTLGEGFAEAHHRVALNRLTKRVQTDIDDLVTVCANCHRMLHRMEGKPDDVVKLKAIVRKCRNRK